MDWPIEHHHLDEVDSTSLECRRMVQRAGVPSRPLVITATRQTGGRGRQGRAWQTLADSVALSILWPVPPSEERAILEGLGLRIGVACVDAVASLFEHDVGVQLKWPNDVMINGRKAGGILIEVESSRHVDSRRSALIIGIGLNWSGEVPADLSAATVLSVGRPSMDRQTFSRNLVGRVGEAAAVHGLPVAILARARALLHGVGFTQAIRLGDGSTRSGILRSLNDDGEPVLDGQDGPWSPPRGAWFLPD